MKYNERIREIREDNFLTQQKIADLLHIGQRTYSDYESGKTRIPIDNLIILAKFYNVSMDYITGVSNIKREYPKK
ncbi:transcriptional regulator [Eubacterium sp. An3]|nr:helix-turn-helix transcriptional regulator [Eubacterium sp. An3]OUO29749.1 transcriptional regulator [Eubacterium sp. An3]